ncbi:MAG: 3-hydroxybutyryl-CoA dehydrogenase [Euryarchaeota archaeon]|nr:3-hydroxybutyryl-CoA dehydrogenase [Euryarchaeota archaeon]
MIRRIGVVGAGQMGAGIAQVAAGAGYEVIMSDIEDRFLEKGMHAIAASLGKGVERGKVSEAERAATLGRIRTTLALADLAASDLVIEAVVEDRGVKKAVFAELDALCPPATIFASNTSSISITELAGATKRSDRFVGMHFFNPVPVMRLVEIVRGLGTGDETVRAVRELAVAVGKTPVEVRDFPGFVSNRILMPFINEAFFALGERVASREDIDTVAKLGLNHPMGPLELADLIGLDTCLAVLEVLHADFGDAKYRPAPLLRQLVRAGRLGRKTGRGVYEYPR